MIPIDQSWFWVGVFGLTSPILIHLLSARHQRKMKMLEVYGTRKLEAYQNAYLFINKIMSTFDPDNDSTHAFISCCSEYYDKLVAMSFPFLSSNIQQSFTAFIKIRMHYLIDPSIRIHSDFYQQVVAQLELEFREEFKNWDKKI